MPTWFWIVLWLLVIAIVAFFAVRQIRSGRRGPTEVDRYKHAAVREAGTRLDAGGPDGASQLWM